MASFFLPDPLDYLRRLVTTLEGRVNALANNKMNSEAVARAVSRLLQASLTAQQVFESVSGRVLKRLNVPSHAQVSELLTALQRIEAKLDQLGASQAHATLAAPVRPRPARTRTAPHAAAGSASAGPGAAPLQATTAKRKPQHR